MVNKKSPVTSEHYSILITEKYITNYLHVTCYYQDLVIASPSYVRTKEMSLGDPTSVNTVVLVTSHYTLWIFVKNDSSY